MDSCNIPKQARIAFGVAVFYGATSIAISLLNKALLSSFQFDCYFLILFSQLCFSFVVCQCLKMLNGNPFNIPNLSLNVIKSALPMGSLYALNIGVGLLALQAVNVPMFNSLRKLVAPIIILYEYFSTGKIAAGGIQLSVGVIVCGVLIAGWDSLSSDGMGYFMTMINNVMTAASSMSQKKFSQETKFTTFGIVYCNASVAAPIAFAFAVITGELERLATFKHLYETNFLISFGICSAMGLMITYATMLCTIHNSPLATSITGNIKDVLTTIIGWIIFPGFVATAKSVLGVILAFVGGFMYSYVGLMQARAATPGAKAIVEKLPGSSPSIEDGDSEKT